MSPPNRQHIETLISPPIPCILIRSVRVWLKEQTLEAVAVVTKSHGHEA